MKPFSCASSKSVEKRRELSPQVHGKDGIADEVGLGTGSASRALTLRQVPAKVVQEYPDAALLCRLRDVVRAPRLAIRLLFREDHLLRLDHRSIGEYVALVDDGCREVVLAHEAAFGAVRAGAMLRLQID